ncbi:MAG: TlyA family RNA methyltransferase [Sporichthyaceae bacterium]
MSTRRLRLDAELVRRGLARSREHAGDLISAGRVSVHGRTATKSATQVELADPVLVTEDSAEARYASRGGHKLAGALDCFDSRPGGGPVIEGRLCLDAGASTGGFTDVLLRRGAAHVIAVDVGYGQLAWSLQSDERVTVRDRTNVRDLAPGDLGPAPQFVVADLSFISLAKTLPFLAGVAAVEADLVVMVKPQFEVGKERLGAGGVVRDPQVRALAVRLVAEVAGELGLGVRGVTASPLPGPAGNVEYFLWLRPGAPPLSEDDLHSAMAAGPS